MTSSLVSPLTNYKHILYPRIHFRSTPVVIVLFLHARTDNKEFVSPVAEGKKVKISLLQAVEAPRVVRGRGSHIT
jgi:hypothetical protein